MTETKVTIHDFLTRQRIRASARRIATNPHMDNLNDMDHWSVTLRRGRSRMTVPFSMGYGHHGKEPEAADVLSCLASDSASVNMSSFEDWCGDLGYDVDSRKAERTYRTSEKQADKLKQFLGQDAYDELLYHTEPL